MRHPAARTKEPNWLLFELFAADTCDAKRAKPGCTPIRSSGPVPTF
jgi:hypothetical protein